VAAQNETGVSDFVELSQPVTAKSQHDPPGPPRNLAVSEHFKNSITITWQPPESDGGAAVTGYHIERRVLSSNRWLKINKEIVTEETFKDTEVVEDTEYEYRTMAENSVGVGPPCEPCQGKAVDPWTKPGAPGIPEFPDIKDGQIQVTWTPPEDDGGSPITNYVLEYRAEGAFQWTKASTKTIEDTKFLVKKLNKDQSYEFRVAAENRAGLGPFSQSTSPVKAAEVLVGNPPEITKPLEDQTVVVSSTAQLTCDIAPGEPAATISWLKNGRDLPSSPRYETTYEDTHATLTIKEIENNDEASYMCKAANKLGTVDTEAKLTVHVAPNLDFEAQLREPVVLKSCSLPVRTSRLRLRTPPQP
jgi:titin